LPGGRMEAKLEETLTSGNFPRRYYPDRVQRVSLSLTAACCPRAKHPCFVESH
jgi:hypothetical protein